MRQIEIDEEVWEYLQNNAEPFVDKPNQVLRRLLGLDAKRKETSITRIKKQSLVKRKKPKTNIQQLFAAEFLTKGQTVFLCDYRGKTYRQYPAILDGQYLRYQNQRYSMSQLAKELLQELGHQSDSVRGPAHWCTENGTTIKDLWESYLKQKAS